MARTTEEFTEIDYYVRRICGNTVEDVAPEKCPICGTSGTKFFKIT